MNVTITIRIIKPVVPWHRWHFNDRTRKKGENEPLTTYNIFVQQILGACGRVGIQWFNLSVRAQLCGLQVHESLSKKRVMSALCCAGFPGEHSLFHLKLVPKKRKNWYPPTCPNSLMFGTLDPWFAANGNIFWKWMLLPDASRMYMNLCNACTFSSCIWSAGWHVQLNHTDQMWTFHMWA